MTKFYSRLFYVCLILLFLNSNYCFSKTYSDEKGNPKIKEIQRILQLAGYYNYSIDGNWRNGSKKALSKLLNRYKIKNNGALNKQAIEFLENSFSFLDFQNKYYKRVRVSFKEKENKLKEIVKKAKLSYPLKNIFIRILKKEQVLEVWSLNKKEKYQKVIAYEFSDYSGDLGPKRKQGDGQIPEGFYYIQHFNPVSNFYLSMKVNYPNKSDKILGGYKGLGGDIFIHGSNVTIGCIPITDDKIKELYLICLSAISQGQLYIPVHIFPTKLSEKNIKNISKNKNKQLLAFWNSLKPGYDYFEKHKQIPNISVNNSGYYTIK